MPFVFDRLYRRLGRVYFVAYGVFDVISALIICLGTVGLFTVTWVIVKGWFLTRPLTRWIAGQRDEEASLEAWRTGVTFPRQFVSGVGWKPFALVSIPIAVFATVYQGLPAYSGLIL